jgi:hypothetical protein
MPGVYGRPRLILLARDFRNRFPIEMVGDQKRLIGRFELRKRFMQYFASGQRFSMSRYGQQGGDSIIGLPLAQQAPMFGFAIAQGREFRQFAHPRDELLPVGYRGAFRNGLAYCQDERIMHDLERVNMSRTTYTPNHGKHGLDDVVVFGLRQTQARRYSFTGANPLLIGMARFIRGVRRRRITHIVLGYERIGFTKQSSTVMFFFAIGLIYSVLFSRQALAHEAPTIAPTRLEFDATEAPKNCNDERSFAAILATLVPNDVMKSDAEQRLLVRVHRTPTRGKLMLMDVTLTDARGATIKERHERYGAKTECHKVLYEAAYAAATLLGAFEKPPASEPCPICPPPPACPGPARCPEDPESAPKRRSESTSVPLRQIFPPLAARRAYFGAGVLFGTGITPQGAIGPTFALGFVPSRHSARLHVEFAGAWTSQDWRDANAAMNVIPMFGSVCYSRYAFHLCSGMTTTFFSTKQATNNTSSAEFRVTLAGHLRLGAEFDVAGPLSIRVDAFAQMRFAGQTFGPVSSSLDTQSPVDLGAMAMGVWSME